MYTGGVTTTEKRPRGRPATGETPKRYARVGALWDRCVALADQRGETMTAFLIRALEREEKRLIRQRLRETPWQEKETT